MRCRSLPSAKNLALFGNTSYSMITGGTGSGDVNEAYTVSMVEGLKAAGITADTKLAGAYSAYLEEHEEEADSRRMPFMPAPPMPEMALAAAGDRPPREGDRPRPRHHRP